MSSFGGGRAIGHGAEERCRDLVAAAIEANAAVDVEAIVAISRCVRSHEVRGQPRRRLRHVSEAADHEGLPFAASTRPLFAFMTHWRLADLHRRVLVAEAVAELSHQAISADQPDELLRESLRVAIGVTGAVTGAGCCGGCAAPGNRSVG